MACQRRADLSVLVRSVVVHDQVQVQFGRRLGVDVLQELQPFLVPMPLLAKSDDAALQQFQRAEYDGRARPHVIVHHHSATALL